MQNTVLGIVGQAVAEKTRPTQIKDEFISKQTVKILSYGSLYLVRWLVLTKCNE